MLRGCASRKERQQVRKSPRALGFHRAGHRYAAFSDDMARAARQSRGDLHIDPVLEAPWQPDPAREVAIRAGDSDLPCRTRPFHRPGVWRVPWHATGAEMIAGFPYQRLGPRVPRLFGYDSLWMGPDHLLAVHNNRFVEEYRRFEW